MLVCEVTGNVWATKKEQSLVGLKLMVVKELNKAEHSFVAADVVGAGIGETVLVATGSTARKAISEREPSVDAAIVGIIDSLEVDMQSVSGNR
ncbi:MAG: EutN/CcmL family microcompartment protein [Clostridiales bacterium]|nr:EutN/CcmL family microcompartment protein [Clostridiales bacterium]MDY3746835.1 EutN/CcmL family microcompartment protein [Lachnospiraceae bacterium]